VSKKKKCTWDLGRDGAAAVVEFGQAGESITRGGTASEWRGLRRQLQARRGLHVACFGAGRLFLVPAGLLAVLPAALRDLLEEHGAPRMYEQALAACGRLPRRRRPPPGGDVYERPRDLTPPPGAEAPGTADQQAGSTQRRQVRPRAGKLSRLQWEVLTYALDFPAGQGAA
jgi:hypothetical protein